MTTTLPLLTEPAELQAVLGAPDLLVVDLCRNENYDRHHIPGAVHVEPAELVSGVRPAVGRLPDKDRLVSLFSRIGYQPDLHIVAYDDEGGGWAGRFIWTLDVIGHQRASLLDGGLIAWADEDRPMTAEVPGISASDVSLRIDTTVIAEKDDILESLPSNSAVIWDARSPEEHQGSKVVSARGGRIPGAINLDWLETMDRQRSLRLRKDLRDLLAQRGIADGRPIITHCQSHHRSGLTYFIGKYLGLPIRAYHGSWSEWGNDPDTPVESDV